MWQSSAPSSAWRQRIKPYVRAILGWGAIGAGILVLFAILMNITGLDESWLKINLWERTKKVFAPLIKKFDEWWGPKAGAELVIPNTSTNPFANAPVETINPTTETKTTDFDLFKI